MRASRILRLTRFYLSVGFAQGLLGNIKSGYEAHRLACGLDERSLGFELDGQANVFIRENSEEATRDAFRKNVQLVRIVRDERANGAVRCNDAVKPNAPARVFRRNRPACLRLIRNQAEADLAVDPGIYNGVGEGAWPA